MGFTLVSGKDNVVLIPEADSQSFSRDDPVGITSGQVTALSDAAEDVYGIALRDSNNDTNNEDVPVAVVTPEQKWRINLKAGATADTPAEIAIGAGYKLDLTSSVWTLDGDTAATAGHGFIVEEYRDQDASTSGAPVIGRFARLACLGVEG